MARNQIAKKSVEGSIVTFTFADGRTLNLDVAGLNDEMKTRLAVHGAAQKIGDSYAGAESVAQAFDAANAVLSNVVKGEWGRERGEGGAESSLFTEVLIRFMKQAKNVDVDAAWVTKQLETPHVVKGQEIDGKAWGKLMRQLPDIIRLMAEVKAERSKVSVDDLV